MDALQQDVADRDHQLEMASKKEQQLRNRLKKTTVDDTLQRQAQEAEHELRALQKQLNLWSGMDENGEIYPHKLSIRGNISRAFR